MALALRLVYDGFFLSCTSTYMILATVGHFIHEHSKQSTSGQLTHDSITASKYKAVQPPGHRVGALAV
jgi:hypothetical protein